MNNTGFATRLNYEIEQYDGTLGKLIAWVNITQLSSNTDTTFYMYYGNPTTLSQQVPEDTWDSSYLAVWHMNDATPSTISDSTVNQYTGTKSSANQPNEENGSIGKSQNFDGINDYLQFMSPIIPVGMKTLSAWFKCDTANNWGVVLTSGTGVSSGDSGTGWELTNSGNRMICYMGNGGGSSHFMKVYVAVPDTTSWHFYTMTYDGITLRMYIDGTLANSTTTTSGSESNPTNNLRMGLSNYPGLPYPFDGKLDEIRIAHNAVSGEWVATEYANQNNPTGFYTIGPEVPGP
jgi:hypothetical protein